MLKVYLKKGMVEISREEIKRIAKLAELVIDYRAKYLVKINGNLFPAKRLLCQILKFKGVDLNLTNLSTQEALSVFKKLGFEVIERKGKRKLVPVKTGKSLLDFAGKVALGGNALEDERKLYSS